MEPRANCRQRGLRPVPADVAQPSVQVSLPSKSINLLQASSVSVTRAQLDSVEDTVDPPRRPGVSNRAGRQVIYGAVPAASACPLWRRIEAPAAGTRRSMQCGRRLPRAALEIGTQQPPWTEHGAKPPIKSHRASDQKVRSKNGSTSRRPREALSPKEPGTPDWDSCSVGLDCLARSFEVANREPRNWNSHDFESHSPNASAFGSCRTG